MGTVEVNVLEPRGGSSKALSIALCIHGMSPNPDIAFEWAPIAPILRERGVAVVYPYLHGCERTAPGRADPQDVRAALEDITRWAFERFGGADGPEGGEKCPPPPLVVYGKSWGGARAVELVDALPPGTVLGAVLACPSPKVADLEAKLLALPLPVLLLWARDDQTIPFEVHEHYLNPLRRRPSGEMLTHFVPIEAGGHRVAPFMVEGCAAKDKLVTWADLAQVLVQHQKQ